jgi:hypothetical protein
VAWASAAPGPRDASASHCTNSQRSPVDELDASCITLIKGSILHEEGILDLPGKVRERGAAQPTDTGPVLSDDYACSLQNFTVTPRDSGV